MTSDSSFSLRHVPQSSTCVFEASRFKVLKTEGMSHSREMIDHPGAVVILPITNDENVVLIKNRRFAVGEILFELPAGTLEPLEAPEDTAKRELQEETGYTSQRIEPLTFFYTTPGFCNERMFAYVAHDLSSGPQHLDPTEEISVEVFPWPKVLQMIKSQEIRDGKSIATLLYYYSASNLSKKYTWPS